MITQERRTNDDRRTMIATPIYPFFDSEDTLIREDRRTIAERRLDNIAVEEPIDHELSSNEDIIGDKRLFVWFSEEIHEIKRSEPHAWMGRSAGCLATFSSRYVSRQHARLYYENGAYYLADNSTNGTYIRNDDGETFLTKGKVIIKGSGVISLGLPLDHDECEPIHFFIG